MRTAQWVRLVVLAFAFMSVVGVMAVLSAARRGSPTRA